MIKAIKSAKSKPSTSKMVQILLMTFAVLTLGACGSSNEVNQGSEELSVALPDALLGSRVNRSNLSASISYGTTTQAMAIDEANNQATTTLTGVPVGTTTFTITFSYDFGGTLLTLAQASQTIDVTEGSGNTLSFAAGDFDTSFDEDGDGISNIVELDENLNSNPRENTCVIGNDSTDSTTLDNCVLG